MGIWTDKFFGIIYVLDFVHYLSFETIKILCFRAIIGSHPQLRRETLRQLDLLGTAILYVQAQWSE